MGAVRLFVDEPDLLRAIGGVAVESSILDEFLREAISSIAGHEIWILVEGQPTDWLCQTFRLILGEVDPKKEKYGAANHERLNVLINRVGELRSLRNIVVHGTWQYSPSLGAEPEEISPRPWGGDLEDAYVCIRSRLRKIFHEQYLTVSDIDRLAEEMRDLCRQLITVVRTMHRHYLPDSPYRSFARWPDDVVTP